MKFKTNLSRSVLAGAIVVGISMLATVGVAQERRDGGQQGGQSRGQGQTRSTGNRSGQMRQRQTTTSTRGTQVHMTQQRTNIGSQKRTRSTQTRSYQNGGSQGNYTRGTSTGRYESQYSGGGRALRYQNGPTGRGISASSWRSYNPNWNGGYYYQNGGYFYDTSYSSPAIVLNEWGGIAALAGGIALMGVLDEDPTLVFSAEVGNPYSYNQFQLDLDSSDPELRLRAAYFRKPYFWRNGVRYDRMTVTFGGAPAYQFRRHSSF